MGPGDFFVDVLKMNVLPRVLFYMQIIPICLPRSFSTLNSLFEKYIRHRQSPRLALCTLQCSKRMGGMGVSVIRKYYEAVALQQILDWHHGVIDQVVGSSGKIPGGPESGSCAMGAQRALGVI